MNYDFGTGGWDIEFDNSMGSGDSITVVGGMGVSDFASIDGSETLKTYVKVTESSTYCTITVTYDNEVLRSFRYGYTSEGHVRVIAHANFISVYINGAWAHTFHFPYATYRSTRYVALLSASSETVTNVRLKELSDWREAIWIDMESSGMNAITSVILQRPVEIYPRYDGSISFTYDPTRSEVTLIKAKILNSNNTADKMIASDAIVYFSDVAVVPSEEVARDYGFITRMYRFPDLEQDAIQAAKISLEDAIRRSKPTKFAGRYNPKLELGDIGVMTFTHVSTGEVITRKVIVESIRLNIMDGIFQFDGDGRYGDAI